MALLNQMRNEPDRVRFPDPVNHPAYYNAGGIECIDAMESMAAGYPDPAMAGLAMMVVKYVWRCPLKGRASEDLKKARFYLDRMINKLEETE